MIFIDFLASSHADMDHIVFSALITTKKSIGQEIGVSADLEKGAVFTLHYGDASIFEIHTPLSIFLACCIGSKLGLNKYVLEVDKAE